MQRDISHITISNNNTQNNTDNISPLNQSKRSVKDNPLVKSNTKNKGKFDFFSSACFIDIIDFYQIKK